MKLFIDTAHIPDIEEIASWGIIDPREILHRICEIVKGPVSAEVVALDTDGMVKEARELAAIHKNIVIKIPFTVDGLKAVRRLADEGIRTNVMHVLEAAVAGADIATVPPKVLRQIVKHPLTDIGIERFLADWEKVKGGKAK